MKIPWGPTSPRGAVRVGACRRGRGARTPHRNRAVGRVVERLRLDAAQHGAAARLVTVIVRALPEDDFVDNLGRDPGSINRGSNRRGAEV